MNDTEQRIREHAYQIWLEEGCPEGRDLDHWDMAIALVSFEDDRRLITLQTEQNLGPVGEPIEPLEVLRDVGDPAIRR
jgi:hypothetical protein